MVESACAIEPSFTTKVFGAALDEQDEDRSSALNVSTPTLHPQPSTTIDPTFRLVSLTWSVAGAFPLSLTSPAVIWSNVPGAVLASVMSPEVTSSRIAMSPLGPLADEVEPPGR